MKVVVTESGGTYQADVADRPGSPSCGTGPTPQAALARLVFIVARECCENPAFYKKLYADNTFSYEEK